VNWEARYDESDKWYRWRVYKQGHDLPIINIVPGDKAEEYAHMVEALPDLLATCERIPARLKEVEAIIEREGFTFDGKDGCWQKLAFTLYSAIVVEAEEAEYTIAKARDDG